MNEAEAWVIIVGMICATLIILAGIGTYTKRMGQKPAQVREIR